MTLQKNHSGETERILREYKRRDSDIPKDFYSLEHPGNLFSYEQRLRQVLQVLKNERLFPLKDKAILEVGCGKGDWLIDFQTWGAEALHLHGIDLSADRLEQARNRLPHANLNLGDAAKLPWNDKSFDLVLQSTVFTSILSDDLKGKIAGEMLRVLKPRGVILWYDFHCNNPKNPNVKGIAKSEIRRLFQACRIEFKRITLAPPVSRFLAGRFWILCLLLEKIKIFNTHYLAVIRKAV